MFTWYKKTIEQQKAESRLGTLSAKTFYNNPKYRGWIYQCLLLISIVGFFYAIIDNTLDNMAAQGIKSGFDFLSSATGFDVLMSLIPFSSTDSYLRIFWVGLLNTLLVSAVGIIASTVLGFIFGVAYFSRNWLIKQIAVVYVEIFRNIPVILQVLFWYSAVLATLPTPYDSLKIGEAVFLNITGLHIPKLISSPGSGVVYLSLFIAIAAVFALRYWARKRQELTGQPFPVLLVGTAVLVGLPFLAYIATGMPFHFEYPTLGRVNFTGGINLVPELMALAFALSIYTSAFIAEAVRAGIQSVPKGQAEAARSVGLKESKIMSLIIVPQSMRVITPMLNSEYQSLVKNSTIATAIGYPELFTLFAGSALNQVGQAIEMMFMTLAVYFLINMIISFVMNHFSMKEQQER